MAISGPSAGPAAPLFIFYEHGISHHFSLIKNYILKYPLMVFQMLDEYVHEVCAETKCYMGDRGEWVIYLDGVIYAKVIPEDAIQKQKAKRLH